MPGLGRRVPRWRVLLVGLLMGGVVGLAGGVAAAVEHPHFAACLRDRLLDLGAHAPGQNPSSVVVQVDTEAPGRPISPLIYGVSGAGTAELQALGATVNRWGGNPSSRYNWVHGHAWNAARDWEFRNGNYGQTEGLAADRFIAQTLAARAVPLITIPMLGWVARNDDNETRSRNVPADGGPPVTPGSSAVQGYDPAANRQVTSLPSLPRRPGSLGDPADPQAPVVYQDEWVRHLLNRFGGGSDGVRYFAMDNEPDLWASTHTDIHPVRMGYEDTLRTFEEYATAVKAQHPRAVVQGPVVSGWTAYWYSALDRGTDRFATHADRRAHGDEPFLKWWLGQVGRRDAARGSRLLDLLDVHYYPQAERVFSDAADPRTQALRIRSTRSLFDSGYRDESWIGEPVMLIPRLKQWISERYPGTGIAITEYNWGGENDASGAVALAAVLGIFGREGVDLATYWTFPEPQSPAGAAFRLYRNFDGRGGTFGDRSLPARASHPGVAAFAARHSDSGDVDVILINQGLTTLASLRLQLLRPSGRADAFQLRGGSSQIEPLRLASSAGPITLPPLSVTLLRLMVS